jgi:hypothetical protein
LHDGSKKQREESRWTHQLDVPSKVQSEFSGGERSGQMDVASEVALLPSAVVVGRHDELEQIMNDEAAGMRRSKRDKMDGR